MKVVNNFYIRTVARALMHKRYGTCIGGMAIVMAMSIAFSQLEQTFALSATTVGTKTLLIALLIALLSLAVTAPANIGVRSIFCDLASSRETKASNVFLWYGDGKRLGRSILLMLLQSLIIFGCAAVFGGMVFGTALHFRPDIFNGLLSLDINVLANTLLSIYGLLFVAAVPTYLIVVNFLPATYLLAADPEKKPIACLKESCQLLKGFYWRYVGLQMLSLLQVLGYTILASVVSTLFANGSLESATTSATLITMVITYFNILPHLGISTALFLNDARVRPAGENAGLPGDAEDPREQE